MGDIPVKPELTETQPTERRVVRRGVLAALVGLAGAATLKVTGAGKPGQAEAAATALLIPGAPGDPFQPNTAYAATRLTLANGVDGTTALTIDASGGSSSGRSALALFGGGNSGAGVYAVGSGGTSTNGWGVYGVGGSGDRQRRQRLSGCRFSRRRWGDRRPWRARSFRSGQRKGRRWRARVQPDRQGRVRPEHKQRRRARQLRPQVSACAARHLTSSAWWVFPTTALASTATTFRPTCRRSTRRTLRAQ